MNRYNVVVRLTINVAVNATTPNMARAAVIELIELDGIAKIAKADFIIEDHEVTGVFDPSWIEVD